MIKITREQLYSEEASYPGLVEAVRAVEAKTMPTCALCESPDTAQVLVGVTGRMLVLAAATTRIKLLPNGIEDGDYHCNQCGGFFRGE